MIEHNQECPVPEKGSAKYVLGIEGSANKIGIGIVDFDGKIYSNPR